MKHKTKARIIAGVIIFLIYILYVILKVALGWKHGGGVVVFTLFSSLAYYVWKTASDKGEAKDYEDEIFPKEQNNPSIPDEEEGVFPIRSEVKLGEESYEKLPPIPSDQNYEAQPSSSSNQEEPPLEEQNEEVSSIGNESIREEILIMESKDKYIENKSTFNVHFNKYKWYYRSIIALILVACISIVYIHKKESKKKQFIVTVDNGNKALKNSYNDLALRYFSEALDIDSTNAGLYYKVGIAYANKNDYNEAAKNYERAYKLNDDESDMVVSTHDTITYDALLRNYFIALLQSSLDKSILLLLAQDYISRCPNDVRAYKIMTIAYWERNDCYNAMEWANKMIEVFPNEFESYFTIACLQYRMNDDYDNAIKNFEISISIKEDNGLAYNNMGECYMLKHQYEKAYDCWRKAVTLGEKSAYKNLKKCGQIK